MLTTQHFFGKKSETASFFYKATDTNHIKLNLRASNSETPLTRCSRPKIPRLVPNVKV